MYLLAWDWTNWSELLIQFNLFKSYQPGRGWGKFLDHLVCSVIFQLRWISQNIEMYHIKPFSQPEVLIWFICTCSITFWEIIRFRGVSNFVVFVSRPPPWIYILNENDFEWVSFFYWNWKSTYPRDYIPTNKQETQNTRKLATNLNDSTVIYKYKQMFNSWYNLVHHIK